MRELFDKLLPIYLENGGELFKFFDMTYGEIMLVISANRKRVKEEYRLQASLVYKQAYLNSFAFNSPKDMPSLYEAFPGMFDDIKENGEVKQDWRQAMANMLNYTVAHNEKFVAQQAEANNSGGGINESTNNA